MLTLYGNLESGNVYKVRQLLAQLGIAHRRVDVAQFPGEPRTAKFPAQPDRQGSDSSFRRRACALGIRRDPVLPRQWYIVPAERIGQVRSLLDKRVGAAVTVVLDIGALRAVKSLSISSRIAFS